MIRDNIRFKRSASLAAVNAVFDHNCDGAGSVLIQVDTHAAAVGFQLVAEGRASDTSPWITLGLVPTNSVALTVPIVITAAFTGIPAFGWRVDTRGISTLRVRVSARTSGACTVAVRAAA